ncbi:PqiB family protein [Zestomonas carbonaria]|uniref:Intermembrane transport protein YebT n=1 Tax=Zestomonas carbonaria TaxID=2762745 RepID=A0A7U7EMR3_9GAMM|nr:MlaD family protein [Pseudomonas carbonaria]CAD5107888.1 Intermembrane transport protein YebT [Pseudomonas carbonaria]
MTDLPTAKVRPASNWSAIWVLPLIALLIGGWLGWRAYSQAGIDIEVFFESGDGLQAGKTEVMYKGMPIGKITALSLDGTRGVIATIEMEKESEPHLRANTRFWLVKPSVTLAGITGLETLVSGNYIAVSPADGEPTRKFQALSEPPPMPDDAPGLHLVLKAERLGSLNRDSPVFYRQIQVGRVKSYVLAEDQKTVEIKVFIESAYASLVRKHTRFWNASGVTVNADLSGLKVRTESLASIVAGGIAFATPENRSDSPPTDPSIPFRLYEDFDAAQAGIKITLKLSDFESLQAGRTPVLFNGIQVGTLKALKINEQDPNSATAELTLDPQGEEYLVEDTEFWVVKPSISLAGITGLEALLKGNYIAVRPGTKGKPMRRDFVARPKAPPLNIDAPGLHLVLFSDTLGSLQLGSPVLYRQLKVGTVQSYQLARDKRQVLLGVHIEQEYANLVNSSTRFWNASGVTLSGGLSGIEVKSESLQTLLAGGVAFETTDLKAPVSRKIQRFRLHTDRESAMQAGQEVRIRVDSGDGLRPGTPIRYKGLDVGEVETVELTDDLEGVILSARITQGSDRIARSGTRFWVVKPELGLIRTANLETLISGQYLQVQPGGKVGAPQTDFTALKEAPVQAAREEGLSLVLSASRLGSIKVGVPVTFREVRVGEVTGFELGSQADQVLIRVRIEPRYVPLVRGGSRFWNASGIGVDAGLFKGVKVRTESLEALISGGIAFASPEDSPPARPGQTFPLFDDAKDEWLLWTPKIPIGK